MQSLEDKLRNRLSELEIKERWYLKMLHTVSDCTKCKLYTVCSGKSECQKAMQRAAEKHVYKAMTSES